MSKPGYQEIDPNAKQGTSKQIPTETTPLVTIVKSEGGGDAPKDGNGGGLTVKQAALLVAGEMAGAGVLALPRAIARTGWIGVPLLILTGAIAAFNGKLLSDCWSIIEERDAQMRSRKRNPYSIIAGQTLGKTWGATHVVSQRVFEGVKETKIEGAPRTARSRCVTLPKSAYVQQDYRVAVVSVAIIVTLFGSSVVYLELAAQLVRRVLLTLLPTVTFCAWYLIVAGAMTPLLMFGSPKDFSFMGTIAFGSIVLACIMYFVQMMVDIRPFVFRFGVHGFQEFFLAIGTFMFAFGGASAFPTIQNDMAVKSEFTSSLKFGFITTLALYLAIAVGGYGVYGELAGPNIATTMTETPLTLAGNVLMVVALLTAFVILINPVCQEVEELYDVPRDSTGWRMGIRLSIMLGILFIGESIPRFYTILALVGATSVALLTFILPPYLYLTLITPREGQEPVETPGWMKMLCWEILAIGVIAGVLATYAAIAAMFATSLATPCYLR